MFKTIYLSIFISIALLLALVFSAANVIMAVCHNIRYGYFKEALKMFMVENLTYVFSIHIATIIFYKLIQFHINLDREFKDHKIIIRIKLYEMISKSVIKAADVVEAKSPKGFLNSLSYSRNHSEIWDNLMENLIDDAQRLLSEQTIIK